VEVLGWQPRSKVRDFLAHCRGFVLTAKEDFGIAPVEAMAAGRPVIAYRAGGALETVIEGHTGVFFEQQTVESLMAAVDRLQGRRFDKDEIRRHAMRFDKAVFKAKISEFVSQVMRG
jgi:glycosyltransferase involved in cell wall biosynthesis